VVSSSQLKAVPLPAHAVQSVAPDCGQADGFAPQLKSVPEPEQVAQVPVHAAGAALQL